MNETTCKELVERVTDYLEDALSPDERVRLDRHLGECDGCRAHLEQMRAALRIAGALPPETLSEPAEKQLSALLHSEAARRGRP
jgi:anti-sigma factor RsiW